MSLTLLRRGTAIVWLASSIALGQASTEQPIKVDICEVLHNPGSYDGKTISFRGQLEFEFEGDHVEDSDCALPPLHVGIWWDYGGTRALASSIDAARIHAETTPVVKDAEFSAFQGYVDAHRGLRPDGERCGSHKACAYYDVIATFTGKFFASQTEQSRTSPRFGHMGCCHLLVIEQVSEVVPKRTSVPPDEMKFQCMTENWQSEYPKFPTPTIPNRMEANKQFLGDQLRGRGDEALVDAMQQSVSWYSGIDGHLTWSSPDSLTTYTAQFPTSTNHKKTKKHPAGSPVAPILIQVAREHCEAKGN